MTTLLLVVTCLNIIFVLGLSLNIFLRIKEKKEDLRINKGLQLLQHKISILQDLSDKTDEQVYRLVHLLDKKSNELKQITRDANESFSAIKSQLNSNINVNAPNSTSTKNSLESGMDEFSQFIEAINAQNEKIKPKMITPSMTESTTFTSNTMPQDFTESSENTRSETPSKKNQIRPFQFRRI